MAYSAPELLLVGAAQNLVLQGSSSVVDNSAAFCNQREWDDKDNMIYDGFGLW